MARKSGSTIVQEELYPLSAAPARGESRRGDLRLGDPGREDLGREESGRDDLHDARLVDLDVDEESPFLRGQKRVSARRSSLPRKTVNWLLWAAVASAILCACGLTATALYEYGEHSWRFRVESSDNIEVTGMQNVTKAQIMEVMGGDIGRNIFFIPLGQQKTQLEQIPWVESASVMRFVPNRLKVQIEERTPVAFARVGPRIQLIDAGGSLMDLPPKRKYSFPVILGMNPGEPLSTRAPRMKVYTDLVRDLDSGGAHYSQDLSEVNLTDLDDVKVRVNDPAGDVLVHLGSSDYFPRYKTYVAHVQQWRQQFRDLESVDLRYDNQVVVNPDTQMTATKTTGLTSVTSRAAAPAVVKPAALITKVPANVAAHDKAVPKPVFEMTEQKLKSNTASAAVNAKNPPAKTQPKTASKSQLKADPKKSAIQRKTPASSRKTLSGKPANPSLKKANSAETKSRVPAARAVKPQRTQAAKSSQIAKTAPPVAMRALPKPSPAIAKQPETPN